MSRRRTGAICLALLVYTTSMAAGTFQFSTETNDFDPFIVVHPFGYDGVNGGLLEVRVCVSSGLERMAPAVVEAISIWNAMIPETENCTNCELWEDTLNPEAPLSMSSILLHELGHCAFGIDHINWEFGGTMGLESSFTNTANASVIDVGVDGVRGTSDDMVFPLPGADVVHWFRNADNNPFVVDSTIIDISTYSRRIIDLLALGHGWTANANRRVGEALGLMNSQAVMYSAIGDGQRYSALSADDVNTVEFGMSGMDEVAGTADDYSVELIFVADCTNADLEVQFTDAQPGPALCLSDLELLPGGGMFDIHHVMVPFISEPRLLIQVNSTVEWDIVFADGFETGDLSSWAK